MATPQNKPVTLSEVEGPAVAKLKLARKWVPLVPRLWGPGKATNPYHPFVILSEGRAATEVEGPAVAKLKSARKWVPHVSLLRHGKATNPNVSFYLKITQALLLAIAVCFSTAASDSSSRFNDLGHRLMCTCSCANSSASATT